MPPIGATPPPIRPQASAATAPTQQQSPMGTLQRAGGQRGLQVEPQPAKPSLVSRMGQGLASGLQSIRSSFKSLKNYMASKETPRPPKARGPAAQAQAAPGVFVSRYEPEITAKRTDARALAGSAALLLDLATQNDHGIPDGDVAKAQAATARMAEAEAKLSPGDAKAAIRQAVQALSPAQLNQALIGMSRMNGQTPPEPGVVSMVKVAADLLKAEQTRRALAPTPQNLQALLHYNLEGAGKSSLTQISGMPDGHPAKALLLNHLAKEDSLENYNFANAAERLGHMRPGPERTAFLAQVIVSNELAPSPMPAPVPNVSSSSIQEIHHAMAGKGGEDGQRLRKDISDKKTEINNNLSKQTQLRQVETLRPQLQALRAQHGAAAFEAVGADQKQVDSYKAQIAEINKMKALSPEDDSMDGMLSQLQGQLAICEPKQKLSSALKELKSEVGDVTLDAALSPDFEATMSQASQALKQAHDVDLPADLATLQANLDGLPATKGPTEREDDVIGALNDFGKPDVTAMVANDPMPRFKKAFAEDLGSMAAQVGQSKSLASQAVTAMAADPLALVELLRLQPAGSPMLTALQSDWTGVREMHNFIVKFDAAMGQSTPTDKNTALRNLYQTAVQQAEYSGASEGVGNPFEVNLTGDAFGAAALRNCDNAYDQGTDMTQAMQSVKAYLVNMTSSDLGPQSSVKQFAAALAASPLLT